MGARPHRPTTATLVASLISKHIDGTKIGFMRLAAMPHSQVQALVSDRSQVLSPGTLRLLVALLRSISAAAVQDRLLASSPMTRLRMPRSERERIVRLSMARVQALAQAMPIGSKALVITQAGLSLVRRTVRIEWQLSPDGKPPGSTQNPKITTDVAVAERGRQLPLRQGQKVRRESLTDEAGQTSTAGSITATSSKTASATHKAAP